MLKTLYEIGSSLFLIAQDFMRWNVLQQGTLNGLIITLVFPNFQRGKCLYTSMRELIENALYSAESIFELSAVEITM